MGNCTYRPVTVVLSCEIPSQASGVQPDLHFRSQTGLLPIAGRHHFGELLSKPKLVVLLPEKYDN